MPYAIPVPYSLAAWLCCALLTAATSHVHDAVQPPVASALKAPTLSDKPSLIEEAESKDPLNVLKHGVSEVADAAIDAHGNQAWPGQVAGSQVKVPGISRRRPSRSADDMPGHLAPGLADALAGAIGDAANLARELWQFHKPLQEGGHSTGHVNLALIAVAIFVAATTAIGHWMDVHASKTVLARANRPQYWLRGMLIGSYILLIPGLFQVLFSFTLAIELVGLHVTVTKDTLTQEPGPITQSMMAAVQLLRKSGCRLGAILVVVYAVVVPATKFSLLLVGEFWRFSEHQARVVMARRCIQLVQLVSKWACPDMFAYILLLYLVRALNDRSPLIEAPAHLDVGFTCFSVFCICSTFSAMAIRIPEGPCGDADFAEQKDQASLQTRTAQQAGGERGVVWLTAGLCVSFAFLLALGLQLPCMAMKLDKSLLVQPRGPLPRKILPLLELMDLESQVDADVTLLQCTAALLRWYYYGEINCILAFVMLAVFAILFPIVDMVALVFAAEKVGRRAVSVGTEPTEGKVWSAKGGTGNAAMDIARILKQLSMLEVAIMGVVVVCLACGAYKNQGVMIEMRWGLAVLFLAEVVHWVTYYVVQNAVVAAEVQSSTALPQ